MIIINAFNKNLEGQMFENEMQNVRYIKEKQFSCCDNCAMGFLYCYRFFRCTCCGRKTRKKLVSLPRAPVNF